MILIALGANLPSPAGPPAVTLTAALGSLARRGMTIARVSACYRTPAWPRPQDPPFVNAVAAVETALDPAALMRVLHEVESEFGRQRSLPNAPRSLDLDLIDYEGRIQSGPPVLPHPRMSDRAFVLIPLADVAPAWRHPVSHKPVSELLDLIPAAARAQIVRLTD